ncbi:MAG TPA: FAD-dependent oxidoreductase [Pusillimonas sp.]|uniref:NAD(P)/FAD-dependent oxidoreductase n=1 Tax=Pusillimonas sp. TaxID=3040095 RepID=UPI002B4ACF1F|nr:FAD-dependent oxidoreductase [Pusillimonas sp.]HLU19884.1 FAD-dependent oxidoreductase [Pusillimonas sp.]
MSRIVVVGGGHAAAQLCASLAEAGAGNRVVMVTAEPHVPYQRPPLSKSYLKDAESAPAWLRAQSYYDTHGVTVKLSTTVTAIDRRARELALSDGSRLPYDQLVLATGTRARQLPELDAAKFSNVHTLRTLTDADRLRAQFESAQRVLVVGGGFIGLEIAATAAQSGKSVTVLEAGGRLLGRSVSEPIAQFLYAHHSLRGVQIQLNSRISQVEYEDDRVVSVQIGDQTLAVDLVLVGIGAVPNDDLAQQAGLPCDDGVIVDAQLRTSDPAIWAIGDCVRFPSHSLGCPIRLESVQNANDQARCVAANLLGQEQKYAALPWFWSDQGEVRLQIAGLGQPTYNYEVRGEPTTGKFSVIGFEGDVIKVVESINMPADHMAARKLITAGKPVDRVQAVDAAVPLKSLEGAVAA